VAAIRQTGLSVEFDMPEIRGGYSGEMSADGRQMTGKWTQNGAALPLAFTRVEKAPELARPQEPKKPYPYDEQEVAYENKAGAAKLAGTLITPRGAGPFPAVFLITGSGQQDRNESLAGHKPFLVLADHLARKGIAVLRADDRGVGGSSGEVMGVTIEDFAGDALAAVEFLKSAPKIDAKRIGLIGHSEGGVIAPMVALRSADVAFLVLLAGTGVTGERILLHQTETLSKASGMPPDAVARNLEFQNQVHAIVKAEADPAERLAKLKELRAKLPAAAPGLEQQIQMAALPWFRHMLMYDPAIALRKITLPVLALNGELDAQVPADMNLGAIEAALKQAGNKNYTVTRLPKLNHLFQTAKTGMPNEYAQIEETFAPSALDAISSWIAKRQPK
jgi:uncharacterized protein